MYFLRIVSRGLSLLFVLFCWSGLEATLQTCIHLQTDEWQANVRMLYVLRNPFTPLSDSGEKERSAAAEAAICS